MSIFGTYLELGFRHIVPDGSDHVLFVLGLFLASTTLRDVLLQVTTFTVAHATTLAVAGAGLVTVPSRIVEPLIALSIAYVAFENVRAVRVGATRLAVVFVFGLLHGLGFAGGLAALGVPDDSFLPALLGFNLGVEFGQLIVIAVAFVVLGWAWHRPWFRERLGIPLSWLIGMIGLYWTWARVAS